MENDQSPFLASIEPGNIIEGDIISPSNGNDLSTLDEPVCETIKRLYMIDFISEKFNSILQVILWLFFGNLVMYFFQDNHLHFYNNGTYGDL
jgi:hypothetical protein